MDHVIRQEDQTGTNALLIVLVVLAVLLLGFFLFRNGFALTQPQSNGGSINVELPGNLNNGGDTTGGSTDSGNTQPSQQ